MIVIGPEYSDRRNCSAVRAAASPPPTMTIPLFPPSLLATGDSYTIAHQYFKAPLSTGTCVPVIVPEPSPASHATTSDTSSADMKPLYCIGIGGKLCTNLGCLVKISIITSGSTIGVSTE